MDDGSAMLRSENILDTVQYEKFRWLAVLEGLPTGVITTDIPTGRVLYFNEEAEKILRHPLIPPDSTEERPKYGGFYDDGTPYRIEDYPNMRAAKYKEPIRDHVMRYRRGDGTDTWLKISAIPIKDRDGIARFTICAIHDIGQEKDLEKKLRAELEIAKQTREPIKG